MIQVELNETRYPTKPAELWPKMKELRRWHFRKTWEAQSKGAPVIQGIVQAFQGYLSGLGDFANPSFGPYYTVMMRRPEENIKCHEAMEARGWGRDLCSSMRLHLGQMFRGLSTRSPKGDTVIPNFVFQYVGCHSMAKTGQLFTEYLGVPYYPFDVPYEETPEAEEYLMTQLAEGIEWMEKHTGIKYDDEKAVEGTRNEGQFYTGLRAAAQMLPFGPWRAGVGTSYPQVNPDLKLFQDPIKGETLLAVPAISPQVAILHAGYGDAYGNVQHVGSPINDVIISTASDRTIVQVERVVSNEDIRRSPEKTTLHGVDAIVRAPYGAHPYASPGFYLEDEEHIREYVAAATVFLKSGDRGPFEAYLEKYVYRPQTHAEYLEVVGIKRLLSLYEY